MTTGRKLLLRPIRPDDAERLRTAFQALTPEEVRFRFFHPIKELSPDLARSLSQLDPARAFALVVTECLPPAQARIGAVGRVAIDSDRRDAEFALTVGAELRGFGLGRYLLQRLIEWCRKKRLTSIYGRIMSDNDAMLHIARRLGFALRPDADAPGVLLARRALSGAAHRAPPPAPTR
ncbi:GNAT family N-acetyltransferase [Wenzhouxiangella sp. XN79A]|uniref:GNAT family N-acetyltransferase n=1 Tax=Wenzhouxiangella sp. XN79A TaxID=2724193 RepID=UPI00144A58CF|nr:GNAT family N-acetyltransferase [Wenzhouxiangella sp. XN79A]NKI34535.1 GNAT family N-acetyltransferase [Wenzhouxiangella sp. XN79A]